MIDCARKGHNAANGNTVEVVIGLNSIGFKLMFALD
jgi:hypothetical protein